MINRDSLVGHRRNRLTVIAEIGRKTPKNRRWLCLCDCGNYTEVDTGPLNFGNTKSCGCLRAESSLRNIEGARAPIKHGNSRRSGWSGAYSSWSAMRTRCTNPNSKSWAYYGGRGISFHPPWRDFQAFLRDMGDRPQGLTLDRIDPDKDYGPGNCRWASRLEQSRNRRNVKPK